MSEEAVPISFLVSHPTLRGQEIAEMLGWDPDLSWTKGEHRKLPNGRALQGVHKLDSVASVRFPTTGLKVEPELALLLDQVESLQPQLKRIIDGGGKAEIYISFVREAWGQELSAHTIRRMAALNICVSMDCY